MLPSLSERSRRSPVYIDQPDLARSRSRSEAERCLSGIEQATDEIRDLLHERHGESSIRASIRRILRDTVELDGEVAALFEPAADPRDDA